MIEIAIIVGSTRPGRKAEAVAKWVHGIASRRSDARFEVVDIQDFNLPLLDEPSPAPMGKYSQPHTKAWAAKINSFDGFVLVTPEYNHGPSSALKNAVDFLYREWNNKAAAFVGYGGAGGSRAVEQLRLVMAELQVATVRAQVGLSLHTDFENFHVFKPALRHEASVAQMLDQLVAWAGVLKGLPAVETPPLGSTEEVSDVKGGTMETMTPIDVDRATGKTKELLDFVVQRTGRIPNMVRLMANSSAALGAYLAFTNALRDASLNAEIRDRIALAVAQASGCDYTLSTMSALAAKGGLGPAEIAAARRGEADSPKAAAALQFAARIVEERGRVSNSVIEAIRSAGFSDGEITEIVAAVALNIYRSYFNLVARPEVDFPLVKAIETGQ
jgi:AhpD family alkylhydroperoxidase